MGGILDDVQRKFEQSPEWKEYENTLLELADTQASRLDEVGSEPPPLLSTKVGWEDIEISLISDERVQVKVGSQVQTRNYTEMGFEDKRSGKPNHAWGMLRTLARADGIIPNSARDTKEFVRMGKRIERMRRTLRDHFGISSDPIPLDPVRGYCCRFKITRAPSFEK